MTTTPTTRDEPPPGTVLQTRGGLLDRIFARRPNGTWQQMGTDIRPTWEYVSGFPDLVELAPTAPATVYAGGETFTHLEGWTAGGPEALMSLDQIKDEYGTVTETEPPFVDGVEPHSLDECESGDCPWAGH